MKQQLSSFSKSALCLSLCLLLLFYGCTPKTMHAYGVFLGIDSQQINRLDAYRTVVIEPTGFTAGDIRKLHEDGKKVYGYLNIGAVEEYRSYYERFKSITLAVYENWPDERWINVAKPEWQTFLIDELGREYVDMGLDGFFLDNADVYGLYPTEPVFQGLCRIMSGLKAYGLPLIINGGDLFVTRNINEKTALSLFDAVNQESVFTNIRFFDQSYERQNATETAYLQTYLAKAKNCGLSVYLLEYHADAKLIKQIDAYCKENGFLWYNANSLELR